MTLRGKGRKRKSTEGGKRKKGEKSLYGSVLHSHPTTKVAKLVKGKGKKGKRGKGGGS